MRRGTRILGYRDYSGVAVLSLKRVGRVNTRVELVSLGNMVPVSSWGTQEAQEVSFGWLFGAGVLAASCDHSSCLHALAVT
jgi:hypothetical protein